MQYRWGEYRLDRQGALLTRQGRQVDVSRKVLDCLTHLLEHRDRVVGYDELIGRLWGHPGVTHHQLSQVILAARRAIGDSGHAQQWIRTLPGLGYRWTGALDDIDDDDAPSLDAHAAGTPVPSRSTAAATPSAADMQRAALPVPVDAPASIPVPPSTWHAPRVAPWRRRSGATLLAIACLAAALLYLQAHLRRPAPGATIPSAARAAQEPLASLWQSLWRGDYELVSNGLATLPPAAAASPEAGLLAIRLDIERARFAQAGKKLAEQRARAVAAGDLRWQSRLLTAEAFLNGSAGRSGPEVLRPAQSAVRLLETSDGASSAALMGTALSARGYGYMKVLDYDAAMRDLVRARDLLLKAGDTHGAADAADTLARLHMRAGRYPEALALFEEIARYCREAGYPVQEIYALNAQTKIQIELLRWADALADSDRSMQLLQRTPESERRTRVLLLRARVQAGAGRLRAAASQLEEADAVPDTRYSPITAAAFALAADRPDDALAAASEALRFRGYSVNETIDLESEEGAMLLWMTAAQQRVARGGAMPPLPPGGARVLDRPTLTVGRIARGRWLLAHGDARAGEAELRAALAEATRQGHLLQMREAAGPLIDALLARGETAGAEQVLQAFRGHAPERFDADFPSNVIALRVALAAGDEAAIAARARDARASAGERALPPDVLRLLRDGTPVRASQPPVPR
jgi:DNA-binding winged helix-turn-helix (wHTH) protein/tetratricopeptide (TPR) repeat protein